MMNPGLVAKGRQSLNVPLKEVEITGSVVGEFLHAKVMQRYTNTAERNAEFIYTFPMPDTASICGFTARFGGQEVRGAILEKEQAYEKYEKAVFSGDGAALLESYRPNVFQVSLGQIPPDEEVAIEISYLEELKAVDGSIRVAIPTLVAPRYSPDADDMDLPLFLRRRGKPEVQDYTPPPMGEAAYRARIELNICSGQRIRSVQSPSHAILVSGDLKEGQATVRLKNDTTEMDRDFILVISPDDSPISRGFFTEDPVGGVFAYVSFTPELPAKAEPEEGREYVFLIDISGSMAGSKLEDAKTAMNICLRNLSGKDRFNLAAFESRLHTFSQTLQKYGNQSLDKATQWINALRSQGGTEILPAIEFALEEEPEKERIVMLFTDGEVANEDEIIRYVKEHNARVRIFSIGIDTSVNSYFINELARAGNGCSEFVYPGEQLDDKIIRQFSRIHSLYITKPEVRFQGVDSMDIAGGLPARIYDLDPAGIYATVNGKPEGACTLSGNVEGDAFIQTIDLTEKKELCDVLPKLWAKLKIRELEDYISGGSNPRRNPKVEETIITLSMQYSILTKRTSFIATYERPSKAGGLPETVAVPVRAPSGWDMFGDRHTPSAPSAPMSFAPRSHAPACMRMQTKCFADTPSYSGGSGGGRFFNKILDHIGLEESRREETLFEEEPYYDDFAPRMKPDSGRSSELLKRKAAAQNADGSFGGVEDDLEETVEALLAFARTKCALRPYAKQIMKALMWLLKAEPRWRREYDLAVKIYYSIRKLQERKLLTKSADPYIEKMLRSIEKNHPSGNTPLDQLIRFDDDED